MEKFISIGGHIVNVTDVLLVEQALSTTVTLAYKFGKVTTITHDDSTSGTAMRDLIQVSIEKALQTSWTEVVYTVPAADIPFAVTGIAVA